MVKDNKKKKGEKSDKKLHISDVRKRIVIDPSKVIKTNPIYIKEGWGNLFG
jgi:hypothetical protein